MSSPAGFWVYYIVNKISIGEDTFLLTRWSISSTRQYQLYVLSDKQTVLEDDAPEVHEEIFVAILLGLFVLAAIAVMESESRKHNVIPVLPFHRKAEKENLAQNSQKVNLGKVAARKTPLPEKTELISKLDTSKQAEPIDSGNISVVYKLFDNNGSPTSIFKPYDTVTKQTSEDNLKLSNAIHCRNEVAAFRIDQLVAKKFQAGVPETRHVRLAAKLFDSTATGTVRGSLQKFEDNSKSAADYGSGMFATEDIHRIGLLDLKILNCDRHSGNILFTSEGKKLTPIDHALSFPEIELSTPTAENAVFSVDMIESNLVLKNVSFDWLLFPQAKRPFSTEDLNEIRKLDINKHIKLLSKVGMNLKQKLAVYSSLTLLKEAALNHGKTLYDVGCMVQRQGRRSELSTLELLVDQAISKCDKTKIEKNNPAECQLFCKSLKQEVLNFFKV